MDRATLLSALDVAHVRGLEIGPLDRPIVSRDMGPVEYIDRASREELQRWYAPNDKYRADAFVEVDHVWGDQTLLECVGGERAYGYLIASHVIEHVPDLYGWLGEVASVLADGGLGVFAVPDHRNTFDVLRRTSSEAEFIDAYVRKLRRPYPRQIFDHFYNFRDTASPDNAGADPAELPRTHPASEYVAVCRQSHEQGEYIDSHCWVFTPQSLLAALDLASQLDLLPFEIAHLQLTKPGEGEFLLVLRRMPDGLTPDQRRTAFLASVPAFPPPPPTPLELRAADAEARLAAMEASTSWRLTAPLRAAIMGLRRLRGRA